MLAAGGNKTNYVLGMEHTLWILSHAVSTRVSVIALGLEAAYSGGLYNVVVEVRKGVRGGLRAMAATSSYVAEKRSVTLVARFSRVV